MVVFVLFQGEIWMNLERFGAEAEPRRHVSMPGRALLVPAQHRLAGRGVFDRLRPTGHLMSSSRKGPGA